MAKHAVCYSKPPFSCGFGAFLRFLAYFHHSAPHFHLLIIGSRQPIISSRPAIICFRLPIIGSRLLIIGSRLPIIGSRPVIISSRPAIISFRQGIIHFRQGIKTFRLAIFNIHPAIIIIRQGIKVRHQPMSLFPLLMCCSHNKLNAYSILLITRQLLSHFTLSPAKLRQAGTSKSRSFES